MAIIRQNTAASGPSMVAKNPNGNYQIYDSKYDYYADHNKNTGLAGAVGVGAGVVNNNKVNNSSGGYNSSSYGGNYYNDYLAALEAARAQKLNAAKAAIDAQAQAGIQRYNNQLSQIADDYQSLRNQSEVERYKAQKSLREALANRGALDSGAGRQETLTLQNNYGNQINKINTEEAHEKNSIQAAINEILANADAQKAQLEASMMDDVETILNKLLSSGAFSGSYSYNPGTSTSYANAKNSIKAGTNAFSNNDAQQLAQQQSETLENYDNSKLLDNANYSYIQRRNLLNQMLNLGQIDLAEYTKLVNQL